ncbi:unnamed protein product [Diplocarpon coronariae]
MFGGVAAGQGLKAPKQPSSKSDVTVPCRHPQHQRVTVGEITRHPTPSTQQAHDLETTPKEYKQQATRPLETLSTERH